MRPSRLPIAPGVVVTTILAMLLVASPDTSRADDGDEPVQFVGIDGQVHEAAPWTVQGRHHTLYFGQDLDVACMYGGRLEKQFTRLAKVAQVIASSGRQVVFTVAPNKASVNKRDLRKVPLPHGRCTRQGLAAQDRLLDGFEDPHYLSMRRSLADLADRRVPVYWRMDTHWTTLGNTRWAEEIARGLDPALERRQTYEPGVRTINPDVAYFKGDRETRETAPARLTTTPVKVRTAPGSDEFDVTLGITADHSWNTRPEHLTWPGRTLLVGDSFTYVTLESLRPLFRHGRFLWAARIPNDTIIRAIRRADTVVLEVLQRWLAISPLATRAFVRDLKAALR
jgi:alginate O-acetyltransferase complex protein AlgJ